MWTPGTDVGMAWKGPPVLVPGFGSQVSSWLGEDPGLPTQELLRRAKEHGYSGNKTAFYALVAAMRPVHATPIVRFEGLPGEFSQHDFGEVDVRFVDGRKKRVHFFASRLKYSRTVAVTLVQNEKVETLVRMLVRHFTEFGGVPLLDFKFGCASNAEAIMPSPYQFTYFQAGGFELVSRVPGG